MKWALWRADEIFARGVSAYNSQRGTEPVAANTAETVQQTVERLFSDVERPQRVFAVCVAGQDICPVVSDWIKQHWQLDVEFLKTEKQFKELTNAYAQPEQHGADRWAGVVAAYQAFPDSSVCVIGAGTAITFDLVDKSGQHLGGYILPSYATMRASLMAETANVESAFNMQYRQQGIPDNTSDAVNQGLHRLIAAGVRDICQFAQEAMAGPVQIILTGGGAENILAYPDMPEMHHRPDLVMQGLYDIMRQHKP